MTIRDRFIAGIILLTIVFFSSCLGEEEEDLLYVTKVNVGDKLPDFSVTTLDGKTVSTSSLLAQDKDVMIVFFSTTCKDCQLQMPEIEALTHSNSDVVCLCIGRNQSFDDVETYWQANHFTLPCAPQTDDHIYKQFAESGIPRIYLSDRNGIIYFCSDPESFLSNTDLHNIIN